MKISNIPSPDVKTSTTAPARESAVQAPRAPITQAPQRPASPVAPRADAASFSPEGRALAQASSLTADKIGEVRMKILQKAYDNTDILDAVARNILRSGAL